MVPHSLALGLVMARPNEEIIAAHIADHAKDMGYGIVKDASKLSGSKYLSLSHDALPDTQVKVRVSGHDLPLSYGSPGDLDVHTSERPSGLGIHWTDAVADLAGRVGAKVPPVAAREITRRKNAELASEERRQQNLRDEANRRAALPPSQADQNRALLSAHYPGAPEPFHMLAKRYAADFPNRPVNWVRSLDPTNYDETGRFIAPPIAKAPNA